MFKYSALIFGLVLSLFACRRNHMNLISPQQDASIYYIHFDEQTDDAIFEGDTIYIPISREAYYGGMKLRLDSLIITDYAKVDKVVGERENYSKPVQFHLVAENGLHKTYTVMPVYSRSKGNTITNFLLEGQVGRATIIPAKDPQDEDTISVNIRRIFFLTGLDLRLKKAIRSPNSLIVPAENTISLYRSPVRYRVSSEEGVHHYYVVKVNEIPEDSTQIDNSDFEKWYKGSKKPSTSSWDFFSTSTATTPTNPYDNLGSGDDDPKRWASYNEGMSEATNPKFPLQKVNGFRGLNNHNQPGSAAKLITINSGSTTTGANQGGIIPGIIFTGTVVNNFKAADDGWGDFGFDSFFSDGASSTTSNPGPSPEDFRKNSFYGIVFSEHPKSVSFDYKYTPKSNDNMDAFVLLENRSLDGKTVKRLGVAWLRGGQQQSWKTVDLPIFYARDNKEPKGYFPYQNEKLPEAAKDLNYQLPNQPKFTWGDARKDDVTHIVVVFTSSAGVITEKKTGSDGSELWVDNLHLKY